MPAQKRKRSHLTTAEDGPEPPSIRTRGSGQAMNGDPARRPQIAGFDPFGARWCVGAAPTATIGPAYCRRLRYDSLAGDLPAGPAALPD